MDSEEVLEAVLRSRSVSVGADTPATLAVFGESQGIIRRLLQVANRCPRIGQTLMDFVESNPRSYKKGVDPHLQRHKIPRQCHEISEPRTNNGTNSTTVDENFLDRLRAQLLRVRVATLVRQDFVLAKQLGELKDLCRAVCANSGLGEDVFQRLWDMVDRGADPTCTPHTTSDARSPVPSTCPPSAPAHQQGAYGSLARDAAIVSRVRELLRAAAAMDRKGENRHGRETFISAPRRPHNSRVPYSLGEAATNSARHAGGTGCTAPLEGTHRCGDLLVQRQEMVSPPPPPAIENPADALPLLTLAEALGAFVAVNACLAYIAAEENAVIDATRRYFRDTTTSSAVVDWASAVHRLAKWPPWTSQQQLAHSSKLSPTVRRRSTPSLRSFESPRRVGVEGADDFAGDIAHPGAVGHDEDGNVLAREGGGNPTLRNSGNPSYCWCSSGEEVVHAEGPSLYHAVPSTGTIGLSTIDTIPVWGDECREPRKGGGSGVEGGDGRTPRRSSNGSYQDSELKYSISTHTLPMPRLAKPPLTQPLPPLPLPLPPLPSHPLSRVRRAQPRVQIDDRTSVRDTTRRRQGGVTAIHASYSAPEHEDSREWHQPEAPHQSPAFSPVAGGSCDGLDGVDAGAGENSLEASVCDCDTDLLSEPSPAIAFAPNDNWHGSRSSGTRGPAVEEGRCRDSVDDEHACYGNDDSAGVVLEESETTTTDPDRTPPPLAGITEPTAARQLDQTVVDDAAFQYDRGDASVRPTVPNGLVDTVVASPSRRAQQSIGLITRSSAGAMSVLAMREEDERCCALARKRALLRVRLARQRQDLAGAVADANERGFRAARRRRRDEKVAALLIKTCGSRGGGGGGGVADDNEWAERCRREFGEEAVHREESRPRNGVQFTVSSLRSPAHGDLPTSDVDVQSHPADGGACPSSLCRSDATRAYRDPISQQRCWEEDEGEEAPRKPLKIVPHAKRENLGGSGRPRLGWEALAGENRRPRGGVLSPASVARAEPGRLGPHSCAKFDDAVSLAVRLDSLYALPGKRSYFDGSPCGGGGGGGRSGCDGDGKGSDACMGTGVYLVLETGRLRHQTAVQRPACCTVDTCQAGTPEGMESAEAEIAGAGAGATDPVQVDDDAWVFCETVALHLASAPPDRAPQRGKQPQGRSSSFVHNPLRVLVYRNTGEVFGGAEGLSSRRHRSSSRTGVGADRQSDSFVGVATLPLSHGDTGGSRGGATVVGGASRRTLECTFSRPVEVSVLSAEGVAIGWLGVGVCGMSISTVG